jgi:hypothetical protein
VAAAERRAEAGIAPDDPRPAREFPRLAKKTPRKVAPSCEVCDPCNQDPGIGAAEAGLNLCTPHSQGVRYAEKICRRIDEYSKECVDRLACQCDEYTKPSGFKACATCV